jgi:hypothetical protein
MQLATPKGQPRRSFLLVSLINTGAMWGFNGTAGSPAALTPFLAAVVADRGAPVTPPAPVKTMLQPEGAPALQAASLPSGIWSGRVRLLTQFICSSHFVFTYIEERLSLPALQPSMPLNRRGHGKGP